MNVIDEKISCLTVTKDIRRMPLLKRSIRDYCRQSYLNKELVIISDGSRDYARQIDSWVAGLKRDDIRHVYVPGKRRLGVTRNISVAHATGDYICQWDDDDMNHPERLAIQFQHMLEQRAEASLFEDQLQYFYDTGELLWVSWKPDLIPGTLMCHKQCLVRFPYFDMSRGEDACLREALREHVNLAVLSGAGYLNMYTYSGLNVYSRRHHEGIRYSHDPGYIVGRTGLLERHLPLYDLEISDVEVVDKQGYGARRYSIRVTRSIRKARHSLRIFLTDDYRPAPEN